MYFYVCIDFFIYIFVKKENLATSRIRLLYRN